MNELTYKVDFEVNMERTYTFKECEKNNIKHDPVFKNKKFKLYDVGSIADDAKKHCEFVF